MLHQVVQGHLREFLQRVEDRGRSLPAFVRRELDAFLRCGVLAHGFCRVWCRGCGKDELVAFSCKKRGFCPSCGAARMADLAAHLVERVWPDVPVRQWVLTLPYRVRFLCAYDAAACRAVRRILVRAVSGFSRRRAGREGLPATKAGGVVRRREARGRDPDSVEARLGLRVVEGDALVVQQDVQRDQDRLAHCL